jgi:hypothetical protein
MLSLSISRHAAAVFRRARRWLPFYAVTFSMLLPLAARYDMPIFRR